MVRVREDLFFRNISKLFKVVNKLLVRWSDLFLLVEGECRTLLILGSYSLQFLV